MNVPANQKLERPKTPFDEIIRELSIAAVAYLVKPAGDWNADQVRQMETQFKQILRKARKDAEEI